MILTKSTAAVLAFRSKCRRYQKLVGVVKETTYGIGWVLIATFNSSNNFVKFTPSSSAPPRSSAPGYSYIHRQNARWNFQGSRGCQNRNFLALKIMHYDIHCQQTQLTQSKSTPSNPNWRKKLKRFAMNFARLALEAQTS